MTDPPPELLCPLSKSLLRDPVLTTCGHSFERSAIESWFLKEDFCPICNKVLGAKELIPSQTLSRQLTSFQLGVLRALAPPADPWFQQLTALITREARRCELQDMKLFLQEHKLDFYSEPLVRNGFCSLPRLSKLTGHDIDKLGMAHADRVVLLNAIREHALGTSRRLEKATKKNAKPNGRSPSEILQLKADVERIEAEAKRNLLELQQQQQQLHARRVQQSRRNVINTIVLGEGDLPQFSSLELSSDLVKMHVEESKQGTPQEIARWNSFSSLSVSSTASASANLPPSPPLTPAAATPTPATMITAPNTTPTAPNTTIISTTVPTTTIATTAATPIPTATPLSLATARSPRSTTASTQSATATTSTTGTPTATALTTIRTATTRATAPT